MNFIYTYVPKNDDKKLDSEFYLIDVILLLLSVVKLKQITTSEDKIIFYSTKEFINHLKGIDMFDEYKEVPDIEIYLSNQTYEFCHKNCIYKIFVAVEQVESFIMMDHDFIIYDKEFLDKIKTKDLLFSFKEFTKENAYVNTYLPTYDKVVKELGENIDLLKEVNKDYSINMSIYGGNRLDIIKEIYIKISDFYIKNITVLNQLPLMTMFLEQFLFSGQLMKYDVEPYYCWEDLYAGKCHHYTGFRYDLPNRKKIAEELKTEAPQVYNFVIKNFGFYPSYMSKIIV
jgi:hypothetical protein